MLIKLTLGNTHKNEKGPKQPFHHVSPLVLISGGCGPFMSCFFFQTSFHSEYFLFFFFQFEEVYSQSVVPPTSIHLSSNHMHCTDIFLIVHELRDVCVQEHLTI